MWTAIVILGFLFLWLAIYDVLGYYPVIQKIFLWGSISLLVFFIVMGYMLIATVFNTLRNLLGL